ncbi:HD domain-containing phosphohydrolase [Nitrospina sp. 32_T5]|uniref:HD domain-containing phosphohydrolase n=1 Tax=unclassified Nitrospina TaxID=2638683 RepID=UPI003F990FB2
MLTEDDILDGKILIVDDEVSNVKLLEQMLHQRGYSSINVCTDPHEGLKKYQEWGPDLVLLDLNMPGMDGFQFLKEIQVYEREVNPPPILILTANNSNDIRVRALLAGAMDFITKPFNVIEALARIKNMLDVRLLHNQVRQQNQVLDQKIQERTQQLVDTRLEVIQRLGRAAEYRDNETGMHVIRMSKFSALLAESIGMTEEECDLILNASPMHDIGKIGIPDRILLKPGRLTPEEWEVMKTHTTIGAEILSGSSSEMMKMAESIALTHHEKWDGSGYPSGTKEEEIPVEGRIVAIADVFDALTSDRPYKKAWTVEEAVEELDKCAGQHFDPHLVEKFKNILPEVKEIKNQYVDTPDQFPDLEKFLTNS